MLLSPLDILIQNCFFTSRQKYPVFDNSGLLDMNNKCWFRRGVDPQEHRLTKTRVSFNQLMQTACTIVHLRRSNPQGLNSIQANASHTLALLYAVFGLLCIPSNIALHSHNIKVNGAPLFLPYLSYTPTMQDLKLITILKDKTQSFLASYLYKFVHNEISHSPSHSLGSTKNMLYSCKICAMRILAQGL